MKIRVEIWSIAIGLGIGIFATDLAGNFCQNYLISNFLGHDEWSFSMFKHHEKLGWPSKDVRDELSLKLDSSGRKSCVHVTPVEPEYLVTSELNDGTKICCSLGGASPLVPVKVRENVTEYFCGEYPHQQIVSVSNHSD